MVKEKRKDTKSRLKTLSTCIIFLILLMLIVFYFPSFLLIPIPPPNTFEYNSNFDSIKDWKNTTYSIYEDEWSKSRYFVLRKEITFSILDNSVNNSQDKIFESFDKSLASKGWARKDKSAPCWLFFSELEQIIKSSGNRYEVYLHKNEENYSTNDFICILSLVDNGGLEHNDYHIILLTIRPSLFNKIIASIFPD